MTCEGCGTTENLRHFPSDEGVYLCPEHWIEPADSAIINASFTEAMERSAMGRQAKRTYTTSNRILLAMVIAIFAACLAVLWGTR